MDAPLKERLTGALIVVAVLVILVPEMLSGPGKSAAPEGAASDAGPPVRTYSLELGTSSAPREQDQSSLTPQSSEPAAQVAEPARVTEPAQVTEAAPMQSASAAPEPDPQAVAPAPAPAVVPPPPADVKTSRKPESSVSPAGKEQWWTQLGSFSSRDNAERLARELRGKGYSIDVARIKVNGKDLHRVRAGPVASREAAVALQSRLAAAGHKSSLVAP